MKIYDYIFYRFFKFLRNFIDSPGFGTIILMCWLFFFNGITIVEHTISVSSLSSYISKLSMLGYTIFILVFHFLLFTNRRQTIIIEKFSKEGRISTIIGSICVVLYFLLSIVFYFKSTVPRIGGILKL